MKALCLLLLLLTFGAANAQRVAVKNGLMTVDGKPYAHFESDGANQSTSAHYRMSAYLW